MGKHGQVKRFALLPLAFAIMLIHTCFAHSVSERAKIDLFIIIDVSKTVTECRNSCNILIESINCIYSTSNFEEHDRISTILVAGESLVEQPITVHKNESLLEEKRDRLVMEINGRRFVDLKTDLTDLKGAFEDLKNERAQLRQSESEGEDRNCAVLLISDGWHDEGSPDRKPPGEIENRKELKSRIDAIFREDCGLAFFMFHIISPGGCLYKDFWQYDARKYDGIQCLGLYREFLDTGLIQTSVGEMIEFLRKSQKINLKLNKEKSDTTIYSDREINSIRIELQADSTIPRDVVLTYKAKIAGDVAKVRIISPEQEQIDVPANRVSPYSIPLTIKGKPNTGEQYTVLIDFNPDLPSVKISQREVSVVTNTYEKPERIKFRLSKKGTIVFSTLVFLTRKTVGVKATFWAPPPRPIDLTYQPFESLPPGINLSGNSDNKILLEQYPQTVSFQFSRHDLTSGMYKGKLIFNRSPDSPVVEEDYEDMQAKWNKMQLRFYSPSVWYKLSQTLWILCMLFLISMAVRYIYCYAKGIPTGKHKRLCRIIDFNKKFKKFNISITDVVFVLWISLFFIWCYIIPWSWELSIISWLIIFFIVSAFWWVWGRKPLLNYKTIITGVLQIIIALTQIIRLLVLVFRK